jgi:hypothetical protein
MISNKSYCNIIVCVIVTVTITSKNKKNNYNNNLINYLIIKNKIKNIKNKVIVTVTLSCVLLLHYLFPSINEI